MARGGFVGPREVYEGEYGLYRTLVGTRYDDCDLLLATKDLGVVWEAARVAIKPIPACHLVHACSDAAVALAKVYAIKGSEIKSIRALIPSQAVPIVCEDIIVKYMDNARMAIPRARVEKIRDTVFAADEITTQALEAVLAGSVK